MTHFQLVQEMHRQIDKVALQRVLNVWPGSTWTKFFDVDAYVHVAAEHAIRLDAELAGGAKCLDLGCGFGYVALALECLGHKCVAWDAPAEVLKAVQYAIPVSERVFEMIVRNDEKEFLKKFDLIILHGVWPMRDAKGWWEWPDYAKLASKLINALIPGGMLEIICNRGDQDPITCDPARWSMLGETDLRIGVNDNVVQVRRQVPVYA